MSHVVVSINRGHEMDTGCSGERMHSEDESYYGLGMDAVVIGCTRNRTQTSLLWFGHGCSGYPMHSEDKKRDARYAQEIRNTSNVWFLPRRPHPERSAKHAFLLAFTLRWSQ